MQLKDATPIIRAIVAERNNIPLLINQERYLPNWQPYHAGNLMRGGIRKALRIIEQAPVVDAVIVVRCKECQYRYSTYDCPMRKIVVPAEGVMHFEDATTDDGFCDKGKRRANDSAL